MSQPSDPERLADATARRLLERATALEGDGPTLAELRHAATEAGISPAAFDAAVAEWRASRAPSAMRHIAGTSWRDRVFRNAGSFAASWIALTSLTAAQRLLDAPWLVHKLTDPVALAIGALVAIRLRARTATVVLGAFSIALGAEFLMDVASGAPAIHGFGAHMALLLAGVGGVALGRRIYGRTDSRDDSTRPSPPEPADQGEATSDASSTVGLTNAEADTRFMKLLRLRNSSLTRLQLS